MNRILLTVLCLGLTLSQVGCLASHPNSTIGGLLGGTTGGLFGAAIGGANGKSKEGALVGALAGGITGAAIGSQADQAELQYQRQVQQAAAAQQQFAVTLDQIVQMSTNGLSDELIVNQVRSNGIAQRLSTDDIIRLKSQGVSDDVIRELQSFDAAPRTFRPEPTMIPPEPVIHVYPQHGLDCRPSPAFRPPPVIIHGPGRRYRHFHGGVH